MAEKSASAEVRKVSKRRFTRSSTKTENASTTSQASSSSAGSSLASSRVSTPSISVGNTTSNSATVSCSNSSAALAVSDNRQKHYYSREDLMKLRESPLAKTKPNGLSADHEVEDGLWDPDLWISSLHATCRDSANQPVPPREKRKIVIDAEGINRKRPAASTTKPADNGAGEDDDIILGPQRNSFNSGCQVKRLATTTEAGPKRDKFESRDRKETSRIGSGRIQIDRPTDRDQRLGDRDRDRDQRLADRDLRMGDRDLRLGDRDPRPGDRGSQDRDDGTKSVFDRRRIDRDPDDSRMRFPRGSDDAFSGRYGRDDGYRSSTYERTDRERKDDSQNNKGRFDRDRDIGGDRVFERRKDGPLKSKTEYSDRRDYDDRRSNNKSNRFPSRDGYSDQMSGGYNRSQALPEWVTDGPMHQSDTIELHGFESSSRKERPEQNKSPSVDMMDRARQGGRRGSRDSASTDSSSKKQGSTGRKLEESDNKSKAPKSKNESGNVNRKEKALSNSDAETHQDHPKGQMSLNDAAGNSHEAEGPNSLVANNADAAGKQQSHTTSDFDLTLFLNNSVWNPSPAEETNVESRFKQWFPVVSANDNRLSPRADNSNNGPTSSRNFALFGPQSPSNPSASGSMNILDILQKPDEINSELPSIFLQLSSRESINERTVDVAANVKALMNSVNSTGQPVLPAGGKILTVEDLEASLLSPKKEKTRSSAPMSNIESSPSNHQHRNHAAPQIPTTSSSNVGPSHGKKPTGPAASLPAGARITTVEELEAGIRDVQVTQPGGNQNAKAAGQPDLSAFQKLLGLVNRDEAVSGTSPGLSAVSHSMRSADAIHHQGNQGQNSAMLESWMQPPADSDVNAGIEFGPSSRPLAMQPPVQQPRMQQPVAMQQMMFNQPPPQPLPSFPHQLINFSRPTLNSGNNLPMSLPANAMLHQPMRLPMSMSPQLHPHLSPPASSPIMFSTQPPHNITAPMPIHSGHRMPPVGQLHQSLHQFSHGMNQQPSPQDAIQLAYLHSLLKQLDDQRQQQLPQSDRTGTQQFAQAGVGAQVSSSMNNTKQHSFSSIPTAVIRKMASMKADEKLSKEGDAGRPPSSRSSVPNAMLSDASTMPTGLPGSAETLLKGINLAAPNGPVAPNFGGMLPDAMVPPSGYQQLGPAVSDAAGMELNKNGRRPLIGQGAMFHGMSSTGIDFGQQQPAFNGPASAMNHSMTARPGRPIMKAGPPQMPYNYVSGAPPRTNGTLTAEQRNTQNSMLMMQQSRPVGIQQSVGPTDAQVGRLTAQLNQQLQQQLQQQQQQQQQQIQQQQQLVSFLLQFQKAPPQTSSNFGNPAAPTGAAPTHSTTKPVSSGDTIARWFGADVFGDHRLPNMPGQRVMTLDEIECAATPPTI